MLEGREAARSRTTATVRLASILLALALSVLASCGGGTSSPARSSPGSGMPVFSSTPAQNGAVIVTMNAGGAPVHYTIDGSTPTTSSPTYQAPMLVSSNMTINAIAAYSGVTSGVATWTLPTTIPAGTLVWSDEFTNTTGAIAQPNPAVWTYDVEDDYCAWGSSASPCNPAQPNAYVGTDGCLHIVAEQPSSGVYTSACPRTQGLFSILYGRLEARIMVPEAQGLWPAFWTLGNNYVTDQWPACGESDIEERVNAATTPDWNQGTIHGAGFQSPGLGTTYYFPNGQTAAGWHTYGMIWQPGSIQYYVDDPANIYATYTPASLESLSGAGWPFDSGNAQFLIFDLAVGGSWPGPPNSTTPFPSEMLVDYVRVYALGDAEAVKANHR